MEGNQRRSCCRRSYHGGQPQKVTAEAYHGRSYYESNFRRSYHRRQLQKVTAEGNHGRQPWKLTTKGLTTEGDRRSFPQKVLPWKVTAEANFTTEVLTVEGNCIMSYHGR